MDYQSLINHSGKAMITGPCYPGREASCEKRQVAKVLYGWSISKNTYKGENSWQLFLVTRPGETTQN